MISVACEGRPSQPQAAAAAPSAAPVAAAAAAPAEDPGPHFELAVQHEAAGRYVEARAEVEKALAAGAGRDAKLLAAKLAIMRDDLDAALRLLEPLAETNDALVHYNLGLIAQRRNEYNQARSHYLAAAKADPNYAATRYNLAVLTWDAGVQEEARHHAQAFLALSPDDPRAVALRRKVGLEVAAPGGAAPDPSVAVPAAK